MGSLSNDIRTLATHIGADLVGFAPVERFATGPEETRPNHYLPNARSVVSIGIGSSHLLREAAPTIPVFYCVATAFLWCFPRWPLQICPVHDAP